MDDRRKPLKPFKRETFSNWTGYTTDSKAKTAASTIFSFWKERLKAKRKALYWNWKKTRAAGTFHSPRKSNLHYFQRLNRHEIYNAEAKEYYNMLHALSAREINERFYMLKKQRRGVYELNTNKKRKK